MAKKPATTSKKGSAQKSGFGPLTVFAAVKSPVRFLRRNGFVKGVLGGSNGWTAVAATLWVLRTVRKMIGKNEELLGTEKLTGGQFVRIESIKPLTRKQKKLTEQLAVAAATQAKLDAEQAKLDAKAAKADAKVARKLAGA